MPYVAFPFYLFFRTPTKYYRSITALVDAYTSGDLHPKWIVKDLRDMSTPLSVPIFIEKFKPHWDLKSGMHRIQCVAETVKVDHNYRYYPVSRDEPGSHAQHISCISIFGRVPFNFSIIVRPSELSSDAEPALKDAQRGLGRLQPDRAQRPR